MTSSRRPVSARRAATGSSSDHGIQDRDGVGQILAALEQRHHIQHRLPGGARKPRELVHGGDVRRRRGEADDVPAAGVDTVPLLDRGDSRQRVEHLAGLRRQLPVGPWRREAQFLQRRRMHGAVLTDLKLGQVEAEGLGLPDEVLKLAVGLPVGSRCRQRALDEPQVGDEFGRAGVAKTRIVGLVPCLCAV